MRWQTSWLIACLHTPTPLGDVAVSGQQDQTAKVVFVTKAMRLNMLRIKLGVFEHYAKLTPGLALANTHLSFTTQEGGIVIYVYVGRTAGSWFVQSHFVGGYNLARKFSKRGVDSYRCINDVIRKLVEAASLGNDSDHTLFFKPAFPGWEQV